MDLFHQATFLKNIYFADTPLQNWVVWEAWCWCSGGNRIPCRGRKHNGRHFPCVTQLFLPEARRDVRVWCEYTIHPPKVFPAGISCRDGYWTWETAADCHRRGHKWSCLLASPCQLPEQLRKAIWGQWIRQARQALLTSAVQDYCARAATAVACRVWGISGMLYILQIPTYVAYIAVHVRWAAEVRWSIFGDTWRRVVVHARPAFVRSIFFLATCKVTQQQPNRNRVNRWWRMYVLAAGSCVVSYCAGLA